MTIQEDQYVLVLSQDGLYTSCCLIGTYKECVAQVDQFRYIPVTKDRWMSQNNPSYHAIIRLAIESDLGNKPTYIVTLLGRDGTPYSNKLFYDDPSMKEFTSKLECNTYRVCPL